MFKLGRVGIAATAGVAAFVLAAGTASAHECYVASRSAQGNAGAAHSQAWYTFSVEDFANSGEEFPASIADCFLEHWYAGGGPASFTIHVKGANGTDGVLAEPSKQDKGDGRGIDHIEEAYGELFGASVGACL
jgi:hypothetical protein